MNKERVTTTEELIDLFAYGDTNEAAFVFHDDPEENGYPNVRLPINRPDELKKGGNQRVSSEEEIHFNTLAILVAFKEKRLGKGGHVLEKPKKTKRTGRITEGGQKQG